jgi:hypothetical protein
MPACSFTDRITYLLVYLYLAYSIEVAVVCGGIKSNNRSATRLLGFVSGSNPWLALAFAKPTCMHILDYPPPPVVASGDRPGHAQEVLIVWHAGYHQPSSCTRTSWEHSRFMELV